MDGQWSTWQKWQGCSATCGTGVQKRYRSCDDPPPNYGGNPCEGDSFEYRSCSSGSACPVQTPSLIYLSNILAFNHDHYTTLSNWWLTATGAHGARSAPAAPLVDRDPPFEPEPAQTQPPVTAAHCVPERRPLLRRASSRHACPAGFFTCYSGRITCIQDDFACDCDEDCYDGSDENMDWAGCSGMCPNSKASGCYHSWFYEKLATSYLHFFAMFIFTIIIYYSNFGKGSSGII
ncbi:MLP-like protein, partial [Mya arenaria]